MGGLFRLSAATLSSLYLLLGIVSLARLPHDAARLLTSGSRGMGKCGHGVVAASTRWAAIIRFQRRGPQKHDCRGIQGSD
jgi:DNA polymerase/3'-5' exonuclease PolX